MNHYAITINRQFGSLGRPIAQKLSELLNVEYYDRDIVDNACKQTGLSVKEISDLEESANTGYLNMRFPLGKLTSNRQDFIFNIQSDFIRAKAQKEDCIIVGRCGETVLKGHPRLLRIYIYAPYAARLRNCTDILLLSHDDSLKMIDSVDRARDLYHKRYTGHLPSDPNYLDLLINSDFLSVEETACYIAKFAAEKFGLSLKK